MKMRTLIAVTLVSLANFSCSDWRSHINQENILAKVGDQTLDVSELDATFFVDMNTDDSIKLLESYVDMWVKKQLKISEAEKMFRSTQKDIDKKVEDYRNSLLTYSIDQYYIDNSVDTAFTVEQVSEYYDNKRSDFILDRPMVRGLMVKVPVKFRLASKLEELMQSSDADDQQDFVDLCSKNDLEYKKISQWTYFSEALAFLPTRRDYDYEYIMGDKKVHDFTDGDNIYYVYISEVLETGDFMPMDMVSGIIKRIIFNTRKESIIRTHEDALLKKGLDEGQVEIYLNQED